MMMSALVAAAFSINEPFWIFTFYRAFSFSHRLGFPRQSFLVTRSTRATTAASRSKGRAPRDGWPWCCGALGASGLARDAGGGIIRGRERRRAVRDRDREKRVFRPDFLKEATHRRHRDVALELNARRDARLRG